MFAYEATLRLDNPLSFRTNEFGNVIRMSKILHNWALMFAMNGIRGNPEKNHLTNLKGCNVYCTPALPLKADFQFQTFHPFPEAPQLITHPESRPLETIKAYQSSFTILQYKEFALPGSTFRFAVASKIALPNEMVITYGGKQTLQRVFLKEADFVIVDDFRGDVRHPFNALDFNGQKMRMINSIKYSMPPSPLFEGTITEPVDAALVKSGSEQYLVPQTW